MAINSKDKLQILMKEYEISVSERQTLWKSMEQSFLIALTSSSAAIGYIYYDLEKNSPLFLLVALVILAWFAAFSIQILELNFRTKYIVQLERKIRKALAMKIPSYSSRFEKAVYKTARHRFISAIIIFPLILFYLFSLVEVYIYLESCEKVIQHGLTGILLTAPLLLLTTFLIQLRDLESISKSSSF